MKTLEFLLILALIEYCFTDTDCESRFEDLLQQKCKAIDSSCTYDSLSQNCFEIRECSYGNGDSATCGRIYPTDLNTYKCSYVGSNCNRVPKVCSDYNTNGINTDTCSDLQAPDNDQRCFLEKTTTPSCTAHYNQCEKITTNVLSDCPNNVPSDNKKKCEVASDSTCKTVKRYCDDNSVPYEADENICSSLDISDGDGDRGKKSCIYKNNICQSIYEKCNDISVSYGYLCQRHMPLNADKKDYDYTQICTRDDSATGTKCKAEKRKCTDYNKAYVEIPEDLRNEELCAQLEVTVDYKRCAYKESSKECYEEYKTCEDYITNKVETDRNVCESIVLTDKTKKCVYIKEEDKCVTKTTYSSCSDYSGNDKKICESIVLPQNNRSYCILDKDRNCIEKSINCSEAYGKEDCLHIAKANENNKRCAYNSKCYEEYIRCEDFIVTTSNYNDCNYIKLYNGKTCKYEQIRDINGNYGYICRSDYKTCESAETEEECKLMAITGVSDPERKVCDYDDKRTPKCKENYKYCSDYREKSSTASTTCSNIKPYDESGKEIDIRYKCEYEPNVGCQRVPVKCEDAKKNPILCDKFSDYIIDKDKKYCLFNGGECITQYQQCEFFDKGSSDCPNNIIKGNIRNVCALDSDGKCVTKKKCNLFDYPTSYSTDSPTPLSKYYTDLCHSINPNCTFNTDGKCIYEEKDCENTDFYTEDENNKQICENMEASKPYKKCVLKEDKSGCEEVYRELNYSNAYYSYTNNTTNSNQNSSDFIPKGINLLIFMLSLLI